MNQAQLNIRKNNLRTTMLRFSIKELLKIKKEIEEVKMPADEKEIALDILESVVAKKRALKS